MNEIITPDEFVEALAEATRTMTEEVVEEMENRLEEIASETVEELNRISPKFKGDDSKRKYKAGSYAKSWTFSKSKERGVTRVIVHAAKPHWRLTHLLENGHVVRNGTKRVVGNADPIPHISIAEEHAEEKIDRLMEGL